MSKTPTKIKSLARAHTERAIQVLQGIMDQEDSPPAARIAAAMALLDRGWGKPTQPIAGDDDMAPVRTQSVDAKEALAHFIGREAAASEPAESPRSTH